jgi:hypothetical protein
MTPGLRQAVEEVATKLERVAEAHEANAREWRLRSTVERPHTVAVATRDAMASAYRAAGADLRALLAQHPGQERPLPCSACGEGCSHPDHRIALPEQP